jgi:uncharacterized protein (TIGR01777 family)
MDTVLVTGGTGFIGKQLCNQLWFKGYNVIILSRRKSKNPHSFYWNIKDNHIDKEAIINADYIIHLAGAGIADKRWTKKRKQLLFDSRVNSTNLLHNKVKELNPKLKGFIAASGIGYYGTETSEKIFSEDDESGKDFLSYICKFWEKSSLQFNTLKIRTVIFRTGVVFSKEGGALPKILKPIKFGFGAVLGNGNQYMPWIHIDDLCELYIQAIENTNFEGVYNAVAPELITNKELTYQIAKRLNKKIYLPPIPSILLKLFFGQMSTILLKGSRISCGKINIQKFKFLYQTLKDTPLN